MEGKVALVTGSASGIGFETAKHLLKNGLKAVTLADTNSKLGQKALKEIQNEFGENKAIFVETDVTKMDQFENAFKKTVETFQNVDILINNAGILDDSMWEKEIDVNMKGTINGILLGLENYIPKYKSSTEGVIVNLCSVAGLKGYGPFPIYSATKFAIMGMTLAWGVQDHYQRTNVKVVAICPGPTSTPLLHTISGKNLGEPYEKILKDALEADPTQTPEDCARCIVKIIKEAPTGTMWVSESGADPYQFVMPERESFKK